VRLELRSFATGQIYGVCGPACAHMSASVSVWCVCAYVSTPFVHPRTRTCSHARTHSPRAHARSRLHTLARPHVNTEVVARRHVPIRLWDEVTLERKIHPDLIGARLLPPGCPSLAACRFFVNWATLSLTCR